MVAIVERSQGWSVDEESAAFDAADRLLAEWGEARRRWASQLRLPTISSIAQMIAHVRAQEKKQRGVRKKALRKKRRESQRGGPPIEPEEAAELHGFKEPEPTAKGKHDNSSRSEPIVFTSPVMQVERVFHSMPGWMRAPIARTYIYNQPHRVAAMELKMDLFDYRSRWKAGVRFVAIRLATR